MGAPAWAGKQLPPSAMGYGPSPMTKTGMKAPQGTGMVVARADIQNCVGEADTSSLPLRPSPASHPCSPHIWLPWCSMWELHPAVGQLCSSQGAPCQHLPDGTWWHLARISLMAPAGTWPGPPADTLVGPSQDLFDGMLTAPSQHFGGLREKPPRASQCHLAGNHPALPQWHPAAPPQPIPVAPQGW